MRSSLSGNVVLVTFAAAAAAASMSGCSSSGSGGGGGLPFGAAGTAPAPVGTAGSSPVGGSGAPGASGDLGTSGGAPAAGGASTVAGAGGMSVSGGAGGASSAGASGASTAGAAGSSAGTSGTNDITKVAPTAGCGMDPPAALKPGTTSGSQTIMTMGTKPTTMGNQAGDCADTNCGPWSYNREYFVTLPMGYDKTKAYPLVFEGPGCGSGGTSVYPLTDPTAGNAQNAGNTVIRVGLTPPPNTIGHATNPGQGCFDDKEGDSSVDWVFYEDLYDRLAGQLCFDKNRVFSTGNSSGAWFSNELGCKFAGDPTRPVRGIMPNTGGLPTTPPSQVTTCTNKPMAGMWVGETNDPENPFSHNIDAINRAIQVNGCTGGPWGTTPTADYPIGGGKPDTTCKQITGCPALYPLVVCLIPGNQHASHDDTTNPGFTTFLKFFSKPPQLTQ
jgi:hypothetical protein